MHDQTFRLPPLNALRTFWAVMRKATFPNCININVSPYFVSRYLMQRLEQLRERLPGVDLRMTTMV